MRTLRGGRETTTKRVTRFEASGPKLERCVWNVEKRDDPTGRVRGEGLCKTKGVPLFQVNFLLFLKTLNPFLFSRDRTFFFAREKKRNMDDGKKKKKKKQLSGAQKRKKKKEKEAALMEAVKEAIAEMERIKLGPTKLWTGLVLHHKDVFFSHVIPKLNTTDRWFFALVNRESRAVLEYAGVNVSQLKWAVLQCTSISTLEWALNYMPWGNIDNGGYVMDQAWFCAEVAGTNKLEFLKWAREVKHCEWNAMTITGAAFKGNLEMLKYCFSNDCPYDEEASCCRAAIGGHLDCLRFLFDKVEPSRETEKKAAKQAAAMGHTDIMKYFVEERKMSDRVKIGCMTAAAMYGKLDCLKYLIEEAKVPLNDWQYIASARYYEQRECENYLLEKECREPTDEEYAWFVEDV